MYYTKFLVVIALLFVLNEPVLAQTNYDGSQDNDGVLSSQYDKPVTDYPKITSVEKQLYQKSFKNEDIYNRVERIEQTLFHKNFDSEALIDRVDRISDNIGNSGDKNLMQESYDDNMSSNLPLEDLTAMEESALGRSYKNDNPVIRVKRLENEILGATQSGDINYRIERLKIASQNQGLSAFNMDNNDSNFNLGGASSIGSSSGGTSVGVLNYLIPYLRNLLNYNPNMSNTPDYYRNESSSYGATAGVHILK